MSLPTLESVFSSDQIDILQQWINKNNISIQAIIEAVPQGTTDATTAYLGYGINTITNADTDNYAIRLPYPPIEGRSLTIINLTQFSIFVYPSIVGGSINNVVDGVAVIPPDGKSYIFTCYENPLPGAWSWTPPAINQYDSGVITLTAASTTGRICAINSSLFGEGASGSSSLVAEDGKNKPPFQIAIGATYEAYFKPVPFWNSATRIKFYTNTDSLTGLFTIFSSYATTIYDANGGIVDMEGVGAGNVISATATNQTVPGTFVPIISNDHLSFNVGDAGTTYGAVDIGIPNLTRSEIGDVYLGQRTVGLDVFDVWFTQYYKIVFQPSAACNDVDLKFQFFIEFN